MSKKMRLYVWEGVFTDYTTSGIMLALASSVDKARDLIALKEFNKIYDEAKIHGDWLSTEPKVYDSPIAFTLSGGS